MDALMMSLERVVNGVKQTEHVLAETQQQRQALLAAQAAVEQELAKAKEELQAAQHMHSSAAAGLKVSEAELARLKANNAQLKQDVEKVNGQVTAIGEEETQEQEAFIAACAKLREETRSLCRMLEA